MSGDIVLTDEQMSAKKMIQEYKIGILTGRPGTGKTTTINEILNWAAGEGYYTHLCAPTGKAAKRMSEITGEPAETIHRTLGAHICRRMEMILQ
jgi:exodeoxyribonuclease V alpha subunit